MAISSAASTCWSEQRLRDDDLGARSFLSVPASPHLKDYVRGYAERHIIWSGTEVVQPAPASLEPVLTFDFVGVPIIDYVDGTSCSSDRIALVGPHTYRRACVRFASTMESFGVFFQPFGLWQLFGIPNRECTDNAYAAVDVLGRQMQDLWEQLAATTSFGDRVVVVEELLSSMLSRSYDRTLIMNIANRRVLSGFRSGLSDLAHAAGLSPRQCERRFAAEIGMSPKLYDRIVRYQLALDLKLCAPHRTWISIAQQAGYHDQMHMIKDFRRLSGATPARLLAELGDARPLTGALAE
jgi:AraC-like DNA-binding protein